MRSQWRKWLGLILPLIVVVPFLGTSAWWGDAVAGLVGLGLGLVAGFVLWLNAVMWLSAGVPAWLAGRETTASRTRWPWLLLGIGLTLVVLGYVMFFYGYGLRLLAAQAPVRDENRVAMSLRVSQVGGWCIWAGLLATAGAALVSARWVWTAQGRLQFLYAVFAGTSLGMEILSIWAFGVDWYLTLLVTAWFGDQDPRIILIYH